MNDIIDSILEFLGLPSVAGSIGVTVLIIITHRIDVRNQKIYREKKGSEYIVCKEPKEYLWICCLGLIATLALLFAIVSTSTGFMWVRILVGSLIALCTISIFCIVNWRIELFRDQPYFLYRTSFRRTYKIYYDQCQLIHDQRLSCIGDDIVLKVGKKVFYFNKSVSNYYSMIEIMRKHKINETWKMRKKRMKKRPKKRKR